MCGTWRAGAARAACLLGARFQPGRDGHLLAVFDALPGAEAGNSFERQALHAETLGFVHPVTGETLHFESALPGDMAGYPSAT